MTTTDFMEEQEVFDLLKKKKNGNLAFTKRTRIPKPGTYLPFPIQQKSCNEMDR